VSRIIFCGAGKVGSENGAERCVYQMSQRADFFETLIGLDTMGEATDHQHPRRAPRRRGAVTAAST